MFKLQKGNVVKIVASEEEATDLIAKGFQCDADANESKLTASISITGVEEYKLAAAEFQQQIVDLEKQIAESEARIEVAENARAEAEAKAKDAEKALAKVEAKLKKQKDGEHDATATANISGTDSDGGQG